MSRQNITILTLLNVQKNKLFILDDHGYNRVGSYYLGEKGELLKSDIIPKLINQIVQQTKAEKVSFIGSSKGGSAALLYGFKMNVDEIVIGSPQYHIGDYLNLGAYHREIMKHICDDSDLTMCKLNALIPNAISSSEKNTVVQLVYSTNEESYEKDVSMLVEDLQRNNIHCYLEDKKYIDHGDIAKFFIPYIISIFK